MLRDIQYLTRNLLDVWKGYREIVTEKKIIYSWKLCLKTIHGRYQHLLESKHNDYSPMEIYYDIPEASHLFPNLTFNLIIVCNFVISTSPLTKVLIFFPGKVTFSMKSSKKEWVNKIYGTFFSRSQLCRKKNTQKIHFFKPKINCNS